MIFYLFCGECMIVFLSSMCMILLAKSSTTNSYLQTIGRPLEVLMQCDWYYGLFADIIGVSEGTHFMPKFPYFMNIFN